MLWDYRFLIIPAFAWFSVQLFKLLADAFVHKRFNFKRFVETGGMPSSHSAVVTSLMASVGITEGFDSTVSGPSGLALVTVVIKTHPVTLWQV